MIGDIGKLFWCVDRLHNKLMKFFMEFQLALLYTMTYKVALNNNYS